MLFSNSPTVKNSEIKIDINLNNIGSNDPALILPIDRISNNSETKAIRFLGVYFYSNLNFDSHIKIVSSKLSKALYILRASRNLLTKNALKTVYYSLFHCHIVYCLPIWTCTSMNLLKNIILMQKAAIRIISDASYNTHT
jgi:hypothetical protein